MEVQLFIQVMNFLRQESERQLLLKKYAELEGLLRDASANPESNFSDEIFGSKERLKSYLLHNNPSKMGEDAFCVFKKFDTNDVFGEPAANFIDFLFKAKPNDYLSLSNAIGVKSKMLSKQLSAVSQFYEVFEQVIIADLIDNPEPNSMHSGLYLFFEGDLTVKSISELERYTRIWNGIIQSFTELSGCENQELEFTSLQDKSNVLGVTMEESTLDAFMRGSLGILSALYIIEKIRKIQLDLSPLILSNDYFQMLEDEIEGIIDNTATAVVEELIDAYYKADPADVETVSENLNRSLKQILNFAEKGGRFECMPIAGSLEGEALNKGLADSFLNIRQNQRSSVREPKQKLAAETELSH